MLQGTNKEKLREHGNIGKKWKGTREQGPPLGDPHMYSISLFYSNLIMTFWKRRNIVPCVKIFYRRFLLSNVLYTFFDMKYFFFFFFYTFLFIYNTNTYTTYQYYTILTILTIHTSYQMVYHIIRADILRVAQYFSEPHRGEEKCEQ